MAPSVEFTLTKLSRCILQLIPANNLSLLLTFSGGLGACKYTKLHLHLHLPSYGRILFSGADFTNTCIFYECIVSFSAVFSYDRGKQLRQHLKKHLGSLSFRFTCSGVNLKTPKIIRWVRNAWRNVSKLLRAERVKIETGRCCCRRPKCDPRRFHTISFILINW